MIKKHIFFYPDYSGGNPYQKLLYQESRNKGDIVEAGGIEKVLSFIQKNVVNDVIFHLHWLNALWKDCHSERDAWDKLNDFMNGVRFFQNKGGKLIWTIHNHLPHENIYSEQDFRLRCFLCEYADRVHLHCASHVYELSYLPLNINKVFIQRHGSYLSYYGNFSLEKKIQNFSIQNLKAVFIGMLRGYKNVDKLLEIASVLTSKGVEVTILGKPDSNELTSYIANYCNGYGIKCILRRLTEQEVHEACIDSDIGILSYDRILTSGTLKLYMSYGMQIIAPDLHTINTEDRYNTFFRYNPNIDKKFSYNIQNRADYIKCFTLSYLLAQELGWSSRFLDF